MDRLDRPEPAVEGAPRRGGPGALPPRVHAARAAVALAAVTFTVLLVLVAAGWAPLYRFDQAVVDALNTVVSSREWLVTALRFVTDLGGTEASWLVLPLVVVWLLLRRLPLLALYVAGTGLGAAVLSNGLKALVERVRPVVDEPVAMSHDPSFPSGHALGSTVTYGVLLLVFLPLLPRRARGWAFAATAAMVGAVGLTRIALGVHFPSDVLGGWSLGVVWLAVTVAAFRHLQPADEAHQPAVVQGLEVEARPTLRPAPAGEHVLPHGARSAAVLVAAAVLVWGALVGVGLLVTGPLQPTLGAFDHTVVTWLAQHRTPVLDDVAVAVGALGGTRGVVVVTVAATAIALAVTRRWTPSVFLVLLPVGETVLFLAASTIVDRSRPDVERLSADLPPTASFPSGHVAAAVVTYGGIALLVRAFGRSTVGRVATVVAVVAVVLVAWSRLYRGVHHPTDVVGSLLYASAWLTVTWAVLRPGRTARGDARGHLPTADTGEHVGGSPRS
ncbi:phosphatase PAP2 family protein [Thalassiella azotivora]